MTTYKIREKISKQGKLIRKQFVNALPVMCFFLFLFYSVLFMFGSKYIIVVPIITVFFQINYKKGHSWNSFFRLCGMQLCMSFFAFVATLNFPLRLILNLVVPFWLVSRKSSQFNQMGYFSGLMTFTFLQLMPVNLHGFLIQTAVMLYGLGCLGGIILIYQITHPKAPDYQIEHKGLLLLSDWLIGLIQGEENIESVEALWSCMQSLYQKAYQKRGNKEIFTSNGKISYMFALLFQRAVYFMNSYQGEMIEEDYAREYVKKVAAYIEKASVCRFWERSEREVLKQEGKQFLKDTEKLQGELYKYFRNFTRLFLIILDNFEQKEMQTKGTTWTLSGDKQFNRKLFRKWKLDSFETRFALRMSAVLTLSFTYVVLIRADHGYWLPLNAFLLLRPMYEDSKYRMKTRFIGTAAGCILIAFLVPILPGRMGHIILASMMALCMYTATAGTWVHTLFSTCYALSMTTIAMEKTTAIELRLLYVVIAILLVLAINKFFFPTSMGRQFRYNFQLIFHMHHVYLRILENSLSKPMDYSIIYDAQMQYHLVHDQILQYLKKSNTEENQYYKKLLSVSWLMVSEMEQILFLVNTKRRGIEDAKILETYIAYTDYVLNEIQQMLHLKIEPEIREIEGMNYKQKIEGEPELSLLMTQYAKNLSRLYKLVCVHMQKRASLNQSKEEEGSPYEYHYF